MNITTSARATGVLDEHCERVLAQADLFSEEAEHTLAWIYDADGERLFQVTRSVSAFDLNNALRHGRDMLGRGRRIGEAYVRDQMRLLIGAAPLEAKPE
jgi:hypothetical protein